MKYVWYYETPIGRLGIAEANGVVCQILFGESSDERRETLPIGRAAAQLFEYFDGGRLEFDFPLLLEGTAFQKSVWRALRLIPHGQTRRYGDIAKELGNRGLARAVGMANSRNPLPIVVPCHRVIGADGTLTGYAGGLSVKRYLLDLESRRKRPSSALSG